MRLMTLFVLTLTVVILLEITSCDPVTVNKTDISGKWVSYTLEDGLLNDTITAIIEDKEGNIFLGTEKCLVKYDNIIFTNLIDSLNSSPQNIRAIEEVDQFSIWVANLAGVAEYNKVTSMWGWIDFVTLLPGIPANSIIVDTLKNLWISFPGNGIYNNGVLYSTNNGLVSDSINTLFEDSQGNIWVATNRGVMKYDHVNWMKYTVNDGLICNFVWCITEDSRGNLWFGTEEGVSKYDGANWVNFAKTPNGLASNKIRAIIEDYKGNMWFGTHGYGVCRYDGTNWITLTIANGLSNNYVNFICKDSKGNIWFGTNGGLTKFTPDE